MRIALLLFAIAAHARPAVVPQPVSMKALGGEFRLRSDTAIAVAPESDETRQVAQFLAGSLAPATGFQLKVARAGAIVLDLTPPRAGDHPEGYRLISNTRGVRIEAPSAAGLFYGAQTLLQLLPAEIESAAAHPGPWTIPAVEIVDYPRFRWRGLLLDVSRHFFPKDFVERYIDRMARYKFNVFHWHLTDDQGWRIEIRSKPRRVCIAGGVHLWQCRTKQPLRARHPDAGPGIGAVLCHSRIDSLRDPKRSFQRPESLQLRHAEPVCEHAAVRNDYGSVNTRPRTPAQRTTVLLSHETADARYSPLERQRTIGNRVLTVVAPSAQKQCPGLRRS